MRSKNDQTVRNIMVDGLQEQARHLAQVLFEKKIENLWIIDVSALCAYADFLILGDAENERHMQAALDALDKATSRPGFGISPEKGGRWTLLDLGDIVVDLFLPGVREIYRLEDLYSDAVIYALDEAGVERQIMPDERMSLYPVSQRSSDTKLTEFRAP